MSLAQRDLDRLDDPTRATWETLAALREGRPLREFAHRLIEVVNAVIDLHTVSESGKVGGPSGQVTLTLTVGPSEADPTGATIFTDKVTWKKPEDRSTAVFVGRGGTVHVRPPAELRGAQMALVSTDAAAPSLAFQDGTAPVGSEEAGDGDEDEGRRPYRD